MISQAPSYHGYRFAPEIISHAVWLYHRFCLSFLDTEDLLAQRGITVSYETIRAWCQTFGAEYARTLRRRRGHMGDTWHLDELFVKIQGQQQYLWRAVDEDGDVIDILVQSRRDRRAAARFFRKLLKKQGREPRRLITDTLRSLPEAVEETGPGAAPSDHGHAAQLLSGAPHRNAVRGPQHPAVRKQSSRGLASTDATTRTTDAPVQIRQAPAAILIAAWTRAQPVPCWSSPAPGNSPAVLASPLVPSLG